MFLFKKIVSQFFFPMPLCLILCFTGLALLWWTKRQKTGKLLVTAGLLALTTLSYAPVADALVFSLENQTPVYDRGSSLPAKYVVVLGGGHHWDPLLPIASQIGDQSLKRLVEGIRVYRENPGSKLILSGGSWLDASSDAAVMATTAKLLGISEVDMVLETQSKDTEDQARLIKSLVTTNSFVLVTSATHMPRSASVFQAHGMHPQPAPVEHLFGVQDRGPGLLFPSGLSLRRTERAFYEYLGALWLKLKGIHTNAPPL